MNRKMLDLLACPADKHYPLELHECSAAGQDIESGALYCTKCSRFYPIMEGIPVMLPDDLRDKEAELGFLRGPGAGLPEMVRGALPWGRAG